MTHTERELLLSKCLSALYVLKSMCETVGLLAGSAAAHDLILEITSTGKRP